MCRLLAVCALFCAFAAKVDGAKLDACPADSTEVSSTCLYFLDVDNYAAGVAACTERSAVPYEGRISSLIRPINDKATELWSASYQYFIGATKDNAGVWTYASDDQIADVQVSEETSGFACAVGVEENLYAQNCDVAGRIICDAGFTNDREEDTCTKASLNVFVYDLEDDTPVEDSTVVYVLPELKGGKGETTTDASGEATLVLQAFASTTYVTVIARRPSTDATLVSMIQRVYTLPDDDETIQDFLMYLPKQYTDQDVVWIVWDLMTDTRNLDLKFVESGSTRSANTDNVGDSIGKKGEMMKLETGSGVKGFLKAENNPSTEHVNFKGVLTMFILRSSGHLDQYDVPDNVFALGHEFWFGGYKVDEWEFNELGFAQISKYDADVVDFGGTAIPI